MYGCMDVWKQGCMEGCMEGCCKDVCMYGLTRWIGGRDEDGVLLVLRWNVLYSCTYMLITYILIFTFNLTPYTIHYALYTRPWTTTAWSCVPTPLPPTASESRFGQFRTPVCWIWLRASSKPTSGRGLSRPQTWFWMRWETSVLFFLPCRLLFFCLFR